MSGPRRSTWRQGELVPSAIAHWQLDPGRSNDSSGELFWVNRTVGVRKPCECRPAISELGEILGHATAKSKLVLLVFIDLDALPDSEAVCCHARETTHITWVDHLGSSRMG